MYFKKIILIFTLISLLSCEPYGYNFERGNLPDSPINLQAFNSEYDDYNSTAPSLGRLIPFCFSTNRNSHGNNFDVIYQPMNVNFDKTSGILKVTNEYSNWGIYQDEFEVIKDGLDKINTTGNEFGPYLIFNQNSGMAESDFLLLYATDVNGNFDINYTFNKENSDFSDSDSVRFLNSKFNDLYPAFNTDLSRIYFCSDRENGKFNIFYVNINNTATGIIEELSDTTYHEVFKEIILSGNYDDKCPYIFDNLLVFTSNRPGGFGGFDLYYSRFEDGKWNVPVNFGSKINTESDEYRPILFEEEVDNEKHMMIFSSDRAGGKGGFDLYFVGVNKNI